MSNNRISNLNRTYEDYRKSLTDYVKRYYPDIADKFNDASIGSWLIDMVASVSDNLNFYIDKAYNETNIETANLPSSIYALARSNGFKIPGPKGSMAPVRFSCILPAAVNGSSNSSSQLGVPNFNYAPIIKKGTKVSAGNQIFEVMNDIDFSEVTDNNNQPNQEITPLTNSGYLVTKDDVVIAGESKIYSQIIKESDIVPFMEITIPEVNVMNIESIIFKVGTDFRVMPSIAEFSYDSEFTSGDTTESGVDIYRFFEVDSLIDQYRWGNQTGDTFQKIYGFYNQKSDTVVPTSFIAKGMWKPVEQKFITEFTDNGYLKVTFGSGENTGIENEEKCNDTFTQKQIKRTIRNNFLGKLPNAGWTMYILYRTGGGTSSNVATGAINRINYLNATIGKNVSNNNADKKVIANVTNSITVTNTAPSVSGKDMPTVSEIREMIKYNNAAQGRCVTLKDYENRIALMPPRYGAPFRVSGVEENNKIMLFLLGLDYNGKLMSQVPEQLIENIQNYLSMYRTVNDFIEIKAGRIINLSFDCDLFINKNYNASDVIENVSNAIKDYMDINNHQLGEDIYVGDLERVISNVDGVLNLINLRVYNEFGGEYSDTITTQSTKAPIEGDDGSRALYEGDYVEIDLDADDYILNSETDTMFEIKYPELDIRIRAKVR